MSKAITAPQHSLDCECPQCENNKLLLDILQVLLITNKLKYSDLEQYEAWK